MAKPKKPNPKDLYWARKHKEEAEKAALLPPGLVNHGNTCFMNSVLQGLVATELLEELILFLPPSQRFVRTSASHCSPLLVNGRGPEGLQYEWVSGMSLGDVFLATLERAWRMRDAEDRSSMSPKELLTRLGHKYDQYMDFRQQDAHEFFLHLLDGMRMEEFDIIKHRQPRPSPKSRRRARNTDNFRQVPDVIPEEDRLVSFVDVLWGGRFTSVLICETCKYVSHTYEDFDDLSLSINHDESKERKRDRLRAFASKFISQSNRTREHGSPRPQSASQPPSPSLPTTRLEPMEDMSEPPRRRSFEANSRPVTSPEPVAERHKVEILAGFKNVEDIKDSATQSSSVRPQKANDTGLGGLGRRISVSMSLGQRREKTLRRTIKEQKPVKMEATRLNGRSEPDDDGISSSSAPSKPTSRQPSPGPNPKTIGGPLKLPKPSVQDPWEAAYLRRLLEDTTPALSNPFAMLRMTNGSNSAWSKISSTQGVEDCLKMFTAVEALDGDNMFGCRNCWKIANGQAPTKVTSQSEDDSDDSSHAETLADQELQPSRSTAPDLGVSFLESNVLTPLNESHRTSNISTYVASSGLDLNVGLPTLTSRSSPALIPDESGSGSHSTLVDLEFKDKQDTETPTGLTASETISREIPIPTIAPISPPPDNNTSDSHDIHIPYYSLSNKLSGGIASRDSLRLPEAHSRYRPGSNRDVDSSLSSDDSERDEISGASDGDGSLSSTPESVDTRRPRRSLLPRSKQVIYRRALKRYLISRPPPVLVIHLKRFQQVSKSPITLFGNLKKLDDYVSFPEYLDLRPFLAPKKEDYGLGKGALRGQVVEKGKREEDQPCVYRLYSVVVHIGNMLGGHYIAYTALPPSKEGAMSLGKSDSSSREQVPDTQPAPEKGHNPETNKHERQWCYISDTVVRLVSLEEVLKAKAYLSNYIIMFCNLLTTICILLGTVVLLVMDDKGRTSPLNMPSPSSVGIDFSLFGGAESFTERKEMRSPRRTDILKSDSAADFEICPPRDPSDFLWLMTEEPHRSRRVEIMKAHPEVTKLMGHEPLTKFIVLGVVTLQLSMAILLRHTKPLSVPFLLVAYVIGGTANHNIFLAIHEITHNLAFKGIKANKLLAMFANLPIGIPYAVTFKGYHLEHHKHMGEDGIDTDLPTRLELLCLNNVLGKVFFCTFQILFYAFRPGFVRSQKPTKWHFLNIFIQLTFNYMVYLTLGPRPLIYLILSSFFAGSLHPLAGHFIAEHYLWDGLEQETYSYYGILNMFAYNVGYHNEHHDFPSIPWSRLPTLHQLAPEFYKQIPYHPSWPMIIFNFIRDKDVGIFARAKRVAKRTAAKKMDVPLDGGCADERPGWVCSSGDNLDKEGTRRRC